MRTAQQASVVCAHAVNEVAVLYVHMQHSTHVHMCMQLMQLSVVCAHATLNTLRTCHAVNEVECCMRTCNTQHSTHCHAVNEVSVTVLYAHMQLMRLHLGAIQRGSWEQF